MLRQILPVKPRWYLAFVSWLIALISGGCSVGDLQDDLSLDPVITIENNKIICQNCEHGFGDIIEADDDHILIAAYETIYIFKHVDQSLELIQTIGFNQTSGIISMKVKNSILAFGLADVGGTGTVFIYERTADTWDLKQEIQIGRYEDNFGNDIDFTDNLMVIGANALWQDEYFVNPEEGRVYIYRKKGEEWVQEVKFLSVQSKPNDRFGEMVAIYNDFVLASSLGGPLHIYNYNGIWELLRTDTVYGIAISHSEENFLLRRSQGEVPDLYSFKLEPDGSFNFKTINFDFDGNYFADHGEVFEIRGNNALVAAKHEGKCYMFQFESNQWINVGLFESDSGEQCLFSGLEITNQFAIIGGLNSNDYSYIVYFRELY